MAYAGYRFTEKLIKAAFRSESGIVEPTFVYLPGVKGGDAIVKETGCEYFSVPITLGPGGAEEAENLLGKMDGREKGLLEACTSGLKGNIEKGVEFVHNPPPK